MFKKKRGEHIQPDLLISPRACGIQSQRAKCVLLIILQLGQDVPEEKQKVCGVDQIRRGQTQDNWERGDMFGLSGESAVC